jgi:GTPase
MSISSLTKKGFSELLIRVKSFLPRAPLLYPVDFYTSQAMDERVEEVVREKIFLRMQEEIPHCVFVKVDMIEDTQKMLKILCYIYTETDSQKSIVIGK